MGILKEMFSEGTEDNFPQDETVLLAKGKYANNADMMISGYKAFQKHYVYKKVFFKMLLVVIAFASSVLMFVTSGFSDFKAVFMMLICAAIGAYFISEPVKNRKNLEASAKKQSGQEFEIEITNKTIKFTIPDTEENNEDEKKDLSEENSDSEEDMEENGSPTTLIHLDGAVEIIDRDDMFVICVGKKYVFIVPKSAFSKEETENACRKLAAVMGIRYKIEN